MELNQKPKIKNQTISYLCIAICCLLFAVCCLPKAYSRNDVIPVIKFKNAGIKVVLQSIAQKAYKEGKKVNIVVSPSVEGLVSVNLEEVNWFAALEAVVKPYGYGYEWIDETILLVDTIEKISEREAQAKERQEVEPTRTKVFKLKFIDATDAKRAIEPILSGAGRVSVLELTGQAGWEFGSDVTKRKRAADERVSRTKILIVSDISKKLDEIFALLEEIDIMPKQILIKAVIMEVNRDFLKDIGLDFGTGTGASSGNLEFINVKENLDGINITQAAIRAVAPTPSIFGPKTTGLDSSDFQFAFKKLAGTHFEVILHALEENIHTNVLSAPNILTLDNQEASILVGTKFPIVKTEVSTETSQITGGSLDYYQDIGIQLNVVPQICGENDKFINMIIHPAVTSSTETVKIKNAELVTLVEYPKIISREAETQVIVKDGETIAMGGLLKDVKSKAEIGIPILKDIPFVGRLFRREAEDTEKIELVIFITAKIIKPGEAIPQTLVNTDAVNAAFKEKKKK